jgi:hypothetical protein
MRLPRMTTRRWMVAVVVAGLLLYRLSERRSTVRSRNPVGTRPPKDGPIPNVEKSHPVGLVS